MPFLLHVGDLHERRNLAVVVQAIGRGAAGGSRRRRLSLVLAGVDRGVGDRLAAAAADSGVPDAVIRLARCPSRRCARCTAARQHWCIRRATKDSDCRSSRPWRAGRRCSPREPRRFPRSWVSPACCWIRRCQAMGGRDRPRHDRCRAASAIARRRSGACRDVHVGEDRAASRWRSTSACAGDAHR